MVGLTLAKWAEQGKGISCCFPKQLESRAAFIQLEVCKALKKKPVVLHRFVFYARMLIVYNSGLKLFRVWKHLLQ